MRPANATAQCRACPSSTSGSLPDGIKKLHLRHRTNTAICVVLPAMESCFMRLLQLFPLVTFLGLVAAVRADEAPANVAPIHVTINAEKTGPPINPFIYGQFIEHLGR